MKNAAVVFLEDLEVPLKEAVFWTISQICYWSKKVSNKEVTRAGQHSSEVATYFPGSGREEGRPRERGW